MKGLGILQVLGMKWEKVKGGIKVWAPKKAHFGKGRKTRTFASWRDLVRVLDPGVDSVVKLRFK